MQTADSKLAFANAMQQLDTGKCERGAVDWKAAMNQFAILFGERFTLTRG